MFALPIFTARGSDGSAACGGYSDRSEWQRSADEEGALRRRRCRAPQQEAKGAAAPVQQYGGVMHGGKAGRALSERPYIYNGKCCESPGDNGNS